MVGTCKEVLNMDKRVGKFMEGTCREVHIRNV